MTETHRHEPTACPVCTHHLDACAPVGSERGAPEAGDLTVCIWCATILAFDEDRHLVLIDDAALDRALGKNPQARRALVDVQDRVRTMGGAPWCVWVPMEKNIERRSDAVKAWTTLDRNTAASKASWKSGVVVSYRFAEDNLEHILSGRLRLQLRALAV